MATRRQIEANRRNAKKSTGPTTEKGKRIVSKNAVRHGLLEVDGLLPGEDPEQFANYYTSRKEELLPRTSCEDFLIREIIWTEWRIRRVPRIEAGRHIWETYANSRDAIVGYKEEEYRARVTEAISKQYAPELEAASEEDRPAMVEDMNALIERTIQNGFFGHAASTDTTDVLRYQTKLFRYLRKLMTELENYRRPV